MSKVSEVFQSTSNNDKCLIIYNDKSADSLIGAGILKYICENITDVTEEAYCEPLFNEIDNIEQYSTITYVGCIPNDATIKMLADNLGSRLLFVTCDKNDVQKIKSITKKANIEYSETESCALNLYKIAFGEFDDSVPYLITLISDGVMHKFTTDYQEYLKFIYGLNDLPSEYQARNGFIDGFYNAITYKLCEQDEEDEELNNNISFFIENGNEYLNVSEDIINLNKNVIKSEKWKVNNLLSAYVVWSNLPISENVTSDFDDVNIIINFYRSNGSINVELLKKDYYNEEYELEENNSRLTEIEAELVNDPDNIELIKEKQQILSRNTILNYIIDFNCGRYLAKTYKGTGSEDHGFVNISYDVFEKIMKKQAI